MNSAVHTETLTVGQMATNCYLVFEEKSKEAIIVDPGDDAEYISDHVRKLSLNPRMIVATHGHFDHIMAAYSLQLAHDIPFVMHEADVFLLKTMQSSAKHFLGLKHIDPPPKISRFVKEGETLHIGKQKVTVHLAPGHTPGSILLAFGSTLLVGDTIFAGGAVGRTDFTYSEPLRLSQSIAKILSNPPDTLLLPGHGAPTTVNNERIFHSNVRNG